MYVINTNVSDAYMQLGEYIACLTQKDRKHYGQGKNRKEAQ